MKTNKFFGVLMMVSLSFTACKKETMEVPATISAPHKTPEDERASAPLFVSESKPVVITDLLKKTKKELAYNPLQKLSLIKESSGKLTTYFYDKLGRLEYFTIENQTVDAAFKTTFVYQYKSNEIHPISVNEFLVSASGKAQIVRTTKFEYDSRFNKTSEIELDAKSDASNSPLIRRFDYDLKGNCVRMQEIKNGLVLKELTFADFDSHPSLNSSVAAFQLLPGAIIQNNNPSKMIQRLINGFFMEHHFSYRFDSIGNPVFIGDDVAPSETLIEYSAIL